MNKSSKDAFLKYILILLIFKRKYYILVQFTFFSMKHPNV